MRHTKQLLFLLVLFMSASAVLADPIKTKTISKKKWTLVTSDNFEIITDSRPANAILITEQLEKYREFCLLLLNIKSIKSDKKIKIYLTKNRATWTAMGLSKDLVSVHRTDNDGVVTIFTNIKGFGKASLKKSNAGRSNVLNAIASSLFTLSGVSDNYPLWYRVGFAYYLASYSEPKDKIMLGDLKHLEGRLFSLLAPGRGVADFDTQSLFSRKNLSTKLQTKFKGI